MHILEIGADQEEDGGFGRSAQVDPAFRTVPRDHTTFLIWRVTESATELLPRSHYGTFYDGDAYLVYSASLGSQPAGPDVIRKEIKEVANGECVERHIHAWAGERAGALGALALRRGAQLAQLLAKPPAPPPAQPPAVRAALHRETSANESPRLLSYFKDGIRIFRSGIGENGEGPRLYRVKGRWPVLLQLEAASWAALASDGVFVLDAEPLVVLWLGRAANLIEKLLGAKVAYRLARGGERGAMARRIAVAHDGYEQTLPAGARAPLAALGPRAPPRPAAPPACAPRPARLYRASQPPRAAPVALPSRRPAARLEEIKRAPLYRTDLSDDGVYIVDAGSRGVWAWVGASAPSAAGRGAMAAARGLARARGHAGPVSATTAGREPLQFAALFHDWGWSDPRREAALRAARSATTRLDAVSLATNTWLAAETQLPDDGSGALRVWRVRGAGEAGTGAGGLQEVERPQQAVFFDRDCYLALYTYHSPTGDHTILYYWMGGSSPNDLRNLGAKEAKDLYVKLGRLPVQAWVYQGKEPAHFLQIFKGRMITYIGSATDYDPSGGRMVAPSRALIRVSGQYAREARGVEVCEGGEGAGAGGAGRGSCYVVREGARVWVWCAASATGDEREVAKNMAAAEHTLVMQGKEKEDFWAAVGDRRALLVAAPPRRAERPLPPRLFHVAIGAPGHYSFEEMVSFSQWSLAPELAAVLAARGALAVWLGAHCAPRARDDARALARAFLAQDPAALDPETPIFVLSQGREPPNFTGFFPHWKHSLWKSHKSFNAIISALEGKAIVRGGQCGAGDAFDQHEKHPPDALRAPRPHLPPGVDPLTKELYLTHDDFVATFGMPHCEFRVLPAWKQRELKKSVGLF